MKLGLRVTLLSSALIVTASLQLCAQNCPPKDYSGPTKNLPISTVSGTIREHGGLRSWLGLEVKPPVCGQRELQLTLVAGDSGLSYRKANALDGCNVTVTGNIDESPTAYYSADMFIEDGKIEPDSSCHPAVLAPDLSKAAVPSDLLSYSASVTLNFADTSKPMYGHVSRTDSQTGSLIPWRAYVSPWLNASEDLLWLECREGFRLKDATTTENGKTAKPENWLDKETPGLFASEKPGPSSITITCVKDTKKIYPAR